MSNVSSSPYRIPKKERERSIYLTKSHIKRALSDYPGIQKRPASPKNLSSPSSALQILPTAESPSSSRCSSTGAKKGLSGLSKSSWGPRLDSVPSGCDTDSAMEVDGPGMACAEACRVVGQTTGNHALESPCALDFRVPAGDLDGHSGEVAARS